MELTFNLILAGIMKGAIYGVIAMGFVIIYKCSDILNLAHGALVLLGGYITWSLAYQLHLPPFAGIAITLCAMAVVGYLIQNWAMKPLLGESILTLVMATIAIDQLLIGGTMTVWGGMDRNYIAIIPEGAGIKIWNMSIPNQHLFALVIAIAAVAGFSLYFKFSRWGLAMRGVAEGHQIARSMGISVKSILALAWAIAAVLGGIGGVLYGSISGFRIGLANIGLISIPAAFIGGLDSIPGAVLGGVIIGLVESFATGYIGHASGQPMVYLVLILMMFFKPYGLFGREKIERV
jgi:branched-chain amino acid transport system permease protein